MQHDHSPFINLPPGQSAERYYQLSVIDYQQGNFTAAIAAIQEAIKIHPNFAAAYQLLAEILLKLGKIEAANRAAEKARALNQNLFDNPDQKNTTLDSNLLQNPDFIKDIPTPEFYNQEIAAWVEQGKLDDAIASCQKLLTHYPQYAPGYLNWGIVLKKQGHLEKAIAAFRQACQIQPDFGLAYANLALILEEQEFFANAIAHYYQAIQIQPNLINIYPNLSNILNQTGQLDAAIQVLQKALKIEPNSAIIHFNLGNLFEEKKERSNAIAHLQQAWQLDPSFPDAGYNLGLVLKNQGNLDDAIATLQKVIQIHPDFIAAYVSLGYLLEKDERPEAAIALYQRAIEQNPHSADAYKALAVALEQQGQLYQANVYYQKSLSLQPDIPENSLETRREKESESINFLAQNLDNFNEKICLSSRTLAQESSAQSAKGKIIYQSIYPSREIVLQPPKTLDKIVHKNLQLNRGTVPESFLLSLENGQAWADYYTSCVITAEHQLVADVSTGQPLLFFNTKLKEPVEKIAGTVAFLSLLGGATYYHWMADILPKFELIRKSGLDWNDIDKFIVNYYQKSFQKETLKQLGIPETKLLSSHEYPSIQAKRLIVPCVPSSVPQWVENATPGVPEWVCQFLRKTFLPKNQQNTLIGWERIYISRDRAKFRRIVNEAEVIHLLQKFGFKIVVLESLSVAEQAALMASAKVVIAPHGAGLTNLVFCSAKTKVIEIFSPRYVPTCYWIMSQQMKLDYYYLIGEKLEDYYAQTQRSRPEPIYIHARVQDIWVNVDSLLKVLQFAGVQE